jgi:hypothetical protein
MNVAGDPCRAAYSGFLRLTVPTLFSKEICQPEIICLIA